MALYDCYITNLLNQRLKHASKINEAIKSGQSEVAKSYEDAVVFLTGGSGFLGKALIEKLLRSCKIKTIYLLLRPAKDKTSQARLTSIFQDKLYDWLRENQPDFMNKIIPVSGDITEIGLGIDDQMMATLILEVNIIIHGAATINFTEPLKNATLTNVRGTREMLHFGETCQNLTAFIHISTAYVQATQKTSQQYLPEQFVSPTITPHLLIQLAEKLDDKTLELITPNVLQDRPNTYSLTKAVTEELVRLNSGDLPLCIIRPAIVVGMYDEHPGWIDRTVMNGPIGFVVGASLGALHTMYGDQETNLDMVPLDFVTNATIMSGHETIQRRKKSETDIKIYTITATRNPLNIGYMKSFLCSHGEMMSPKTLWCPFVLVTTSKVLFTIITWLLQLFPAYLADFILKLLGKKQNYKKNMIDILSLNETWKTLIMYIVFDGLPPPPRYPVDLLEKDSRMLLKLVGLDPTKSKTAVRLLTKAYKQNQIYQTYMLNSWKFGDSNLVEMFKRQTPVDQCIYNCEITSVKCCDLLSMNTYGVKKTLFKDSFTVEEVEQTHKKLFGLFIVNLFYLLAYACLIWKVFATVFNFVLFFL